MDEREIRLRIVEAVIPQASRVAMQDPVSIINTCTTLESYVLDSKKGETLPDSPPRRKTGRPAKVTVDELPSFLDPTRGG